MEKSIDQLLPKSTSIIHTEDEYGGSEQATCFFISRESLGVNHHYLVTNKHVLKDKVKIHLYLDLYHKDTDTYSYHKKVTLSLNGATKFHDTCDLAILNIDYIRNQTSANHTYSYHALDIKMIPEDYTVFSNMQRVIMLGYPGGIYDTVTNLPVAKSGITSTPVFHNYKGKAEFLIDIPFLDGASGSPIFARINETVYLIGIEYSKLLEKITVDKFKNRLYRSKKYTVEVETGFGIAIRSDQILKLL